MRLSGASLPGIIPRLEPRASSHHPRQSSSCTPVGPRYVGGVVVYPGRHGRRDVHPVYTTRVVGRVPGYTPPPGSRKVYLAIHHPGIYHPGSRGGVPGYTTRVVGRCTWLYTTRVNNTCHTLGIHHPGIPSLSHPGYTTPRYVARLYTLRYTMRRIVLLSPPGL